MQINILLFGKTFPNEKQLDRIPRLSFSLYCNLYLCKVLPDSNNSISIVVIG